MLLSIIFAVLLAWRPACLVWTSFWLVNAWRPGYTSTSLDAVWAWYTKLKLQAEPSARAVTTRDASEFMDSGLFDWDAMLAHVYTADEPLLVKRVLQVLRSPADGWTLDDITRICSSKNTTISLGIDGMRWNTVDMPFGQAARRVVQDDNAKIYDIDCIAEVPEILSQVGIPSHITDDRGTIFVGAHAHFTPVHSHIDATINLLLQGRKLWHLISHRESLLLRPFFVDAPFNGISAQVHPWGEHQDIFARIPHVVAQQEPGDILLWPPWTFHAVQNQAPHDSAAANLALAFSHVGWRSLTANPPWAMMWIQNSLRFLGLTNLGKMAEIAFHEADPIARKMRLYRVASQPHRPISQR